MIGPAGCSIWATLAQRKATGRDLSGIALYWQCVVYIIRGHSPPVIGSLRLHESGILSGILTASHRQAMQRCLGAMTYGRGKEHTLPAPNAVSVPPLLRPFHHFVVMVVPMRSFDRKPGKPAVEE